MSCMSFARRSNRSAAWPRKCAIMMRGTPWEAVICNLAPLVGLRWMAEKSFGNASGSIKRVYYAVTAIRRVPGWPGVCRLLSAEGVYKSSGMIFFTFNFNFLEQTNKRLFHW